MNEYLSLGNRSFVIDWVGQPSCLCLEAVLGLQLCSDVIPSPSGAGWVAAEVLWGSRVEDFCFAFPFRLSTFSMWSMVWKLSGSSKQWNVEWSISLKLKLPSWEKGHGITWDRTLHCNVIYNCESLEAVWFFLPVCLICRYENERESQLVLKEMLDRLNKVSGILPWLK